MPDQSISMHSLLPAEQQIDILQKVFAGREDKLKKVLFNLALRSYSQSIRLDGNRNFLSIERIFDSAKFSSTELALFFELYLRLDSDVIRLIPLPSNYQSVMWRVLSLSDIALKLSQDGQLSSDPVIMVAVAKRMPQLIGLLETFYRHSVDEEETVSLAETHRQMSAFYQQFVEDKPLLAQYARLIPEIFNNKYLIQESLAQDVRRRPDLKDYPTRYAEAASPEDTLIIKSDPVLVLDHITRFFKGEVESLSIDRDSPFLRDHQFMIHVLRAYVKHSLTVDQLLSVYTLSGSLYQRTTRQLGITAKKKAFLKDVIKNTGHTQTLNTLMSRLPFAFQNDHDLIMTVAKYNREALQSMKPSSATCRVLFKNDGLTHLYIPHTYSSLTNYHRVAPDLSLLAIKQNLDAYRINPALANNHNRKSIARYVLSQDGLLLNTFYFRGKRSLALIAVQQNGAALEYVDHLNGSLDVVKLAVRSNKENVRFASHEIRSNVEFMTQIINEDMKCLSYITVDLLFDDRFFDALFDWVMAEPQRITQLPSQDINDEDNNSAIDQVSRVQALYLRFLQGMWDIYDNAQLQKQARLFNQYFLTEFPGAIAIALDYIRHDLDYYKPFFLQRIIRVYKDFPEELKADRALSKAFILQDPHQAQLLHEPLQNDLGFIAEVISEKPSLFYMLSDHYHSFNLHLRKLEPLLFKRVIAILSESEFDPQTSLNEDYIARVIHTIFRRTPSGIGISYDAVALSYISKKLLSDMNFLRYVIGPYKYPHTIDYLMTKPEVIDAISVLSEDSIECWKRIVGYSAQYVCHLPEVILQSDEAMNSLIEHSQIAAVFLAQLGSLRAPQFVKLVCDNSVHILSILVHINELDFIVSVAKFLLDHPSHLQLFLNTLTQTAMPLSQWAELLSQLPILYASLPIEISDNKEFLSFCAQHYPALTKDTMSHKVMNREFLNYAEGRGLELDALWAELQNEALYGDPLCLPERLMKDAEFLWTNISHSIMVDYAPAFSFDVMIYGIINDCITLEQIKHAHTDAQWPDFIKQLFEARSEFPSALYETVDTRANLLLLRGDPAVQFLKSELCAINPGYEQYSYSLAIDADCAPPSKRARHEESQDSQQATSQLPAWQFFPPSADNQSALSEGHNMSLSELSNELLNPWS